MCLAQAYLSENPPEEGVGGSLQDEGYHDVTASVIHFGLKIIANKNIYLRIQCRCRIQKEFEKKISHCKIIYGNT